MSSKHYNADYLVDTSKIMKEIKLTSYKRFAQLLEGTVLDIGCGTGVDVINIAQMSQGRISVIGLDHDDALIAIASNNSKEIENANFVVAEVGQIPFDDNYFSGIRAERLIQHLDDVNPIFQEVYRTLKPGSPFVIVETDWSSLCFYNGDTEIAAKIVDYLTFKKVKNGLASKKILNYYESSNFINPFIEIYPLIANNLNDIYTYLWMDKIILEMVSNDIISSDERKKFVEALETADKNKSFACSLNIVITVAEKP